MRRNAKRRERNSKSVDSVVTMGFGDLKTSAGLSALNDYLADKSYVEG